MAIRKHIKTRSEDAAHQIVAAFMRIPKRRRRAVFAMVLQLLPRFMEHRAEYRSR